MAQLFTRRHAIRYASYLVLCGILALARRRPAALLLLLPGVAAHTYRPYRRLVPQLRTLAPRDQLLALALVPCIRLTGDIAKMAGYPVGVRRRLRQGRPPDA